MCSWTREEFVAEMTVGHGRPGLAAIRPGGTGDVTASHVSWNLRSGIPEIPSPVFHAGRLYLIRDGGVLSCVNAATGEIGGSPTTVGTASFKVQVTGANGAASTRALSILVGVEGGDVTGALPAGMSLVGTTGQISGTPSTSESAIFRMQVTGADGIASTRRFGIAVGGPLPVPEATRGLTRDMVKVPGQNYLRLH
jgi:hypothetical protein